MLACSLERLAKFSILKNAKSRAPYQKDLEKFRKKNVKSTLTQLVNIDFTIVSSQLYDASYDFLITREHMELYTI